MTCTDAYEIGVAAVELGAGRRRLEDDVDPAVGIELLARRGDRIERGETVAVIHARSEESVASAARRLDKAYGFGDAAPEDPPLVWKRVTAD